tara:strand:- start:158 stop:715 length:558 start_codon:yes stop_codon:yes gene_type:complete
MCKRIILIAGIFAFLVSCTKTENDPFLITANQVGPLKKETKINQLDSIFPDDSISTQTSGPQQLRSTDEIKIFDEEGKALLSLEPQQEFDSTSTVGYIRILDPRFKTDAGLNIHSTFQEVLANYNISRIENTINSAVIFLDEINAYITIDKKELPSSLRYDTDVKIRASQIPDQAKIKYFMIYWN